VLVLRCTQKLLKRLGPPVMDPPQSTTALGDWFAQPVAVGHQRYILLVSARSLLPLVIRAREIKHFDTAFADALASVLWRIGVPPADVARELAESREVVVAATNSRSVLGSVNDFSQMMKWAPLDNPDINLTDTALWLGDSPCKPLGYRIPLEVAFGLLEQQPA
jgi:hypothetical protein